MTDPERYRAAWEEIQKLKKLKRAPGVKYQDYLEFARALVERHQWALEHGMAILADLTADPSPLTPTRH